MALTKQEKVIASFERALAFYVNGTTSITHEICEPVDNNTVVLRVTTLTADKPAQYEITTTMIEHCRLCDSGVGYVFTSGQTEIGVTPLYTQDLHRKPEPPKCKHCGSTELSCSGWLNWSHANSRWDMSTLDSAVCGDCGKSGSYQNMVKQ